MSSAIQTYWRSLASGSRTGLLDRLALALLVPLSLPYAVVQQLRSLLYQNRLLKTRRLPRPVVSIGNITVGGTGKTPTCAYIVGLLLEKGVKVAVLSRGYGGSLEGRIAVVADGEQILLTAEECGDEPFLLAKTIPGLIVVIGSDRYAAGMLAMEQLKPDLFLLDDGFQHLSLHRDLNILLLDYSRPFGNGWTLPAGLLREPRRALKRADLIIHTRSPADVSAVQGLGTVPNCAARHELLDAKPLSGGAPVAFTALANRTVLAFAGIAEPQSFFDALRLQGVDVVATVSLPDHASYDQVQLNAISNAMQASGADLAITTEKDGVKLRAVPAGLAESIMLARMSLTIVDPSILQEKLCNLLQKQP